MDLFLALTSDDEDNIMAAMLAKRLGARRVMALINRRAYADMMQGSTIDIAVSPAQTVIGELLAHVRRGDVVAVHSLRRGAAEALEAWRGAMRAPASWWVGAWTRSSCPKAHAWRHRARRRPRRGADAAPRHGDRRRPPVIIFIPNKRQVRAVERLFQVSATFF
jgi:trk system potassium uptake protein TrkA